MMALHDFFAVYSHCCIHTGRGRQVIAVCKSADLLLMVLDASKPHYHRVGRVVRILSMWLLLFMWVFIAILVLLYCGVAL